MNMIPGFVPPMLVAVELAVLLVMVLTVLLASVEFWQFTDAEKKHTAQTKTELLTQESQTLLNLRDTSMVLCHMKVNQFAQILFSQPVLLYFY